MGGFFSSSAALSSDESSGVTSIHSSAEWQPYFNAHGRSSQLLVVDFTASWCGPCRFIGPVFSAMAAQYTKVDFAKIDVDELPDVAKEFKVQEMPTFVLLKGGEELDRVVGAKKDELEKKIQKYK